MLLVITLKTTFARYTHRWGSKHWLDLRGTPPPCDDDRTINYQKILYIGICWRLTLDGFRITKNSPSQNSYTPPSLHHFTPSPETHPHTPHTPIPLHTPSLTPYTPSVTPSSPQYSISSTHSLKQLPITPDSSPYLIQSPQTHLNTTTHTHPMTLLTPPALKLTPAPPWERWWLGHRSEAALWQWTHSPATQHTGPSPYPPTAGLGPAALPPAPPQEPANPLRKAAATPCKGYVYEYKNEKLLYHPVMVVCMERKYSNVPSLCKDVYELTMLIKGFCNTM